MKNKKYQPFLTLIAYSIDGTLREEDEVWAITKQQFRLGIKKWTKWTNYQIKQFIDAYIEIGLIQEENNFYHFKKIDLEKAWTKLDMGTASYCLRYLNNEIFKIYCLLLYRYNKYIFKNQNNSFVEPFKFSRAQICRALKWSEKWQPNLAKVDLALETLKHLQLIEYDVGPFYEIDPNSNSYVPVPWLHLYKVNTYSGPQKEVAKNLLNENILDNMSEDIKMMLAGPIRDLANKQLNKFEKDVKEKRCLDKTHEFIINNELNLDEILDYIEEIEENIDSEDKSLMYKIYSLVKYCKYDGYTHLSVKEIDNKIRGCCIKYFNTNFCDKLFEMAKTIKKGV